MNDSGPARFAVALTPHDTTAMPRGIRAIYVGGAGNIALRAMDSSADVTFIAVPVGTVLPVKATHVRSTSTTATNLVGMG